jgi:hypothetical protein
MNFDSRRTQLCQTAPTNHRVWITHRCEYSLYPGRDDPVGARPGAPDMRTWFEIQKKRRAARSLTSLFQRQRLCVLPPFVDMCSAANDLATLSHHHGAYAWVRRRQRHALPGKFQRLLHELLVSRCSSERHVV